MKKKLIGIFATLFTLFVTGCASLPKKPLNLSDLKSSEELSLASQQSYQDAKQNPDKKEKIKKAYEGIHYSEKCLKSDPQNLSCLYYNVLNRGYYIKHHIPNYQKSLRLMVGRCEIINNLDPRYEHAGCYRILGNIYAKAPAFSLDPKSITQDEEKAAEYFQKAVALAPDYALNYLLLASSLHSLGQNKEAQEYLQQFDQLDSSNLDKEYPEWKEDRNKLNEKLSKKSL